MKRILSLLLCLHLIVCLCAVGVSAAQEDNIPADLCSTQEWEVLRQTNKQRIAQGKLPLSTFQLVQQAADIRAGELTKRFSHTRPNGSEPYTALTEINLNYQRCGENIAAGQTTPSSVIKAWMGSEGHKENILDDRFTHLGVGYTDKPCTIVTETGVGQINHGWVQLFMNNGCTFTSLVPSSTSITLESGATPESLGLYLTLTCSVHGSCYMPLIDEMLVNFDPSNPGSKVTVKYNNLTANILISNGSSSGGSSSGGGFRPIGGGGSSSGGGSTTPTAPTPDLSSADSWAVNWINQANELSLLSEINLSGFNKNVTRLQFADLSVRLAERLTGKTITPADASSFTDTTEVAILKAKAAGIAAGYEVNGKYEFRAQNPITREEICVMLAHVADYVKANGGPALLDTVTEIKGTFLDTSTVADWAVKQVALMTNNNIMGGKASDTGNLIDPKANTALQEAITLAVKLNTPLSK